MLISRKRANSFGPAAPHPSTMLKAMDSADDIICVLRDPRSPRGNDRAALRTPSMSWCALLQTLSSRKFCILQYFPISSACSLTSPRALPNLSSLPTRPSQELALSTTTDRLSTQHLDPLRTTSNYRPSPVPTH